jgi:hypothetical protein
LSGWRLRGLARVRKAEARAAANAAARARARALEEDAVARAASALASDLRREACGGFAAGPGRHPGGGWTSDGLAAWAAARVRVDGQARQLSLESERALLRVRLAVDRARQAAKDAVAARERSCALERGAARWASDARAAREAAGEREVEESWRPPRTP